MDINNTESENNFEQVKSASFEDSGTSQTISEQVKYESSVSNKFASFENSEISQIKSDRASSIWKFSKRESTFKPIIQHQEVFQIKRFKKDLVACKWTDFPL